MAADPIRWQVGLASSLTALAIVLPTLVVHWIVVGYTNMGQLAAALLWPLAVAAWGLGDRSSRVPLDRLWPALGAVGLLALGIGATVLRVAVEPGPILLTLGVLVVAAGVMATAARVGSGPAGDAAVAALAWGLAAAAVLGAALAAIQQFAPGAVDGVLIAKVHSIGRPHANLLQPNHFATVLVLGLLALLLLQARQVLAWPVVVVTALAFSWGVGLSGSRSGLLQLVVLAFWGALGRSLAPRIRWLLILLPLSALLFQTLLQIGWLGEPNAWTGDVARSTGTRWSFVSWALAVIRSEPWLGIGWGETGTAWALSSFGVSQYRLATDNVHNLVLQLAVELGLPLAIAITALLLVGVVRGWRSGPPDSRSWLVAMLVVLAVHSSVEFPLWFTYFLFPAAWILGLSLSHGPRPAVDGRSSGAAWWRVGGVAAAVTAFLVFGDFARLMPDLQQSSGVGSSTRTDALPMLFAHQALAMRAKRGEAITVADFSRARHTAINVDLLEAWSRALVRAGRLDESKFVAQRARALLASSGSTRQIVCDDHIGLEAGLPCGQPSAPVDWRSLQLRPPPR